MSKHDSWLDGCKDRHDDLQDLAERVYDRDQWLPKDEDDYISLSDTLRANLKRPLWTVLDEMTQGNTEQQEAALKEFREAVNSTIWDTCTSVAEGKLHD